MRGYGGQALLFTSPFITIRGWRSSNHRFPAHRLFNISPYFLQSCSLVFPHTQRGAKAMQTKQPWIVLLGLLVSLGAAAQSDDRRARMLERFDTDGDGQLSDSERVAAREARGQNGRRGADSEARRAEILGEFDADGDGQLNESERQALRESGKYRRGGRGGPEGRRRGRDNRDPEDS